MELSPVVEALLSSFADDKTPARGDHHFTVSRTVSILARIYEKARNAVEFRAEHLVRRAAIERILKRRIMLNGGSSNIAENLLVELLWARYIDSGFFDDATIKQIHAVIERYLALKHEMFGSHNTHEGVSWDTLVGLAASEIEDTIVPANKREALVNFFYQAVRPRVRIPEMDERAVNMQTYIAVERAFAQSDDALITYELLKLIQPDWFGAALETARPHFAQIFTNIKAVEAALKNPMSEPLMRFVRKQTPPFLLIRDFMFDAKGKAKTLIENKEELEHKLAELASSRYHEIGTKVSRAMVRSIIYIFLTKMVFALALEVPVDLFITHKIEYLAIAINTLFPPLLLYMVAGFVSVPGPENTRRLLANIEKIFYHFGAYQEEGDIFTPKPHVKRPILTAVFSVFYLVTFLISFGLISFILTRLHFNIASQLIFVFFVTLVSFFAYRIRVSAKEYEMVEHQGFLGPVVDFFFLPILRVGHLLSREIAKINVFIFFFDFILEAPLKVIFEVVEEWIRFVRAKKEEII